MSRRRRQKNPLLLRIFGIAVVVNLLVLVVAAQLGFFKPGKIGPGVSRVVLINPVEVPKEKAKPVTKKKDVQKPAPQRKSTSSSAKASVANRTNLNQPKVIAAGTPSGDSGAVTAAPGGTLAPGTVPTIVPDKSSTGDSTPASTPATKPQPVPAPPVTPTLKPEPKPEIKPEPKPDLVFVDCEPINTPSPVIPDDLRGETLDKDLVAEIVVSTDGSSKSVKTFQSTGISELDDLALKMARLWKFKPASLGGVPAEQIVHLKVEFRVE